MGRREREKKKSAGFHGDTSTKNQSWGAETGGTTKARKFGAEKGVYSSEASYVRTQVDPETAKYFAEIANVIEGTEIDMEERSAICSNALEEARGKEVELAIDYIISHTMQTLLEGCALDNLCDFLMNSAKSFPQIAMDRSGSHVAETALKSLAMHLQDNETYSVIEKTVDALIEAIVVNPVEMMCNCHGSHVLRRLICLCKGVPMESSEFHGSKPSLVLAERLNLRSTQLDGHEIHQNHPPFPDQLKLLSKMLKVDITTQQLNQFSSLVLQTALKLVGEEELFEIIPTLLGCHPESGLEEVPSVRKVMQLVEENAYSHLMEVILAVAPESLYDKIFRNVFKDSLFKMSQHPCANFVVQALISHARSQEHVKLIWEELGTKFKDLLEMGKPGVVAVIIAASQRLQTHELKCCQALAEAVCLTNEPSAAIIPRILFIDDYFYSYDKANWSWPNGAKMHVLGSLLLQSIFRFPSEFIQPYITSIISLEDKQVLEASKNRTGARVIEAFLISSASAKQKRKLISRLRGCFGELSVHSSGSFTVDKCFDASNLSLREAIVSELLPVQMELSKTKQGPYLLKKLDVEGFARRPDQWRSRQSSKESTYKEFYAAFGPKDGKSSRSENFLADNGRKSQPEKLKEMRKEIDTRLSSGLSANSGAPFLAHQGTNKRKNSGNKQGAVGRGYGNDDVDGNSFKRKKQKS